MVVFLSGFEWAICLYALFPNRRITVLSIHHLGGRPKSRLSIIRFLDERARKFRRPMYGSQPMADVTKTSAGMLTGRGHATDVSARNGEALAKRDDRSGDKESERCPSAALCHLISE